MMLRPLLAFPYLLRALAALFVPGRDPRRMWVHARQALRPGRAGTNLRPERQASKN
ncbi:MAG: glycosyltransferase family 2 protein, partial [Sphingopyxis terrae]